MGVCPTVDTGRLVLRPFRDDDLEAYFAVHDTPEVRASLHTPATFDRAAAWQQMAAWLGQWELRGTGQWAVVEKASGQLIGRAGLHNPARPDWPGVEVGWTLHPDHWGKGYATEAGEAARDHAFASLDVDTLYSVILPDNHASQAVAGRLGFSPREERTLSHFPAQPHQIWALERDDWRPARSGTHPGR